MSAFTQNNISPKMVAGGPVTYQNPYYKPQCGCGSGQPQLQITPALGVREGFQGMQGMQGMMGGYEAGSSGCTLTGTTPPAGCCHPAPLHCDCCNGSGFFRASEAYGS